MSDFQARLAQLRAQHAPQPQTPTPQPVSRPQQQASANGHHGTNDGAKEALRQLDLLEVYIRWFQPAAVRPGGNDEVNCSCFNTTFHAKGDRNPQFGINTVKQTYYCHACGVTGDIIDLAAVYYQYADGNFRCDPASVHEVVKAAGEELLGFEFHMTPAGWQRIPEFTPMALPTPTPPRLTLVDFTPEADSRTKELPADVELPPPPETGVEDDTRGYIGLDWRSIIEPGTPMYRYMDLVTVDDSPEEYHFWNFLMLIGLLCGKDVGLVDSEIVYGNLLVCIVGETGIGKSRSERWRDRLIHAAVPFDDASDSSTGIKVIGGAGSGEYMMREFHHTTPDPRSTGGQKFPDLVHPGVRGLVKWSELSEMVGKASGTGSSVREKVMELYDAAGDIQFGSITAGKTYVRNPFGSVMTTTQPTSIRNLFGRKDVTSGFLNRWVFVSGVPKKVHPRGTLVDPTSLKPDVLAIQRWAQERATSHRGLIDLTLEAGEEYDRFILDRAVPLKRADPLYARVDLLYKKLCLLLAANSRERAVSLDTVKQAQRVFDYVIRCYESFGAALASSELSEAQEEILQRLRDEIATTGEGMPGYKIANALKRRYTSTEVKTALKELEDLGAVYQAIPHRMGPGRRPKFYYPQEG